VVTAMPPPGSEQAGQEEHAAGEGEGAHECPKPTYLVATSGIELYGAGGGAR
jgi:hypothetical protein